MNKTLLLSALLFITVESNAQWVWHDPQKNTDQTISYIQNQGWNEDGGNYCRLPMRAKDKVREPLWNLARNSAGLAIRFKTDAEDIKVQYEVSGGYSMPHMPATGVSGVDLYRNAEQGFCFGSYSFGDSIEYSYHIDRGADDGGLQEYTLYLPLYNEVEHLEIGVPEGNSFDFVPAVKERPIVLYGTSIAQGACASRPGMAWGTIVSRSAGKPLVNLGFSGNGRLEPELIDFLNEQDACIYILDCMANLTNLTTEEIRDLVKNAVMQIRSKHDTPILLVEHAGYSNAVTNQDKYDAFSHVNTGQKAAYKELKKDGVKNLFYLSREKLNYHPDMWVDYVHPSDFGMMRQADAVSKALKKIIK